MIIRILSALSGKLNERDLPITLDQYKSWRSGELLVQEAFPQLSKEDREFLISGTTPEEWAAAFPGEDVP